MPRPCLTCRVLVSAGSYCAAHEPSRVSPDRGSGGAAARFRKVVLATTGGRCAIPGCETPDDRVEAHHVRGLKEGGSDHPTNGQPLCFGHHRAVEQRKRAAPPRHLPAPLPAAEPPGDPEGSDAGSAEPRVF